MMHLLGFYFLLGLSSLSSVYDTIFNKDNLSLTADQLISIGIWTGLPWSMKILFGSIVDLVPVPRKVFSLLGQVITVCVYMAWLDFASTRYVFSAIGEYNGMLLIGFLSSLGMVLARMAVDVVAMEAPETEAEKASLQVHLRMALAAGGLVAAILSGPLAEHFSMLTVFAMAALCPAISLLLTLASKATPRPEGALATEERLLKKSKDIRLVTLAVGYSIFITVLGLTLASEGAQLTIFVVSLIAISAFLANQLRTSTMSSNSVRYLVVSLVAIFLFRVNPGAGPALTWYYLDVLKLSKSFLGLLKVTETIAGLILLTSLHRLMVKSNLRLVLILLTIALTLLGIPDILIYYRLLGPLDPRHVLLVDGAAVSALAQIAMVPLGILVANYAPVERKAVFFALTSSLMNLSLVAGELVTRKLNQIWIVTRTDFSQLGKILIASFSIGLILSIVGIVILSFTGDSKNV